MALEKYLTPSDLVRAWATSHIDRRFTDPVREKVVLVDLVSSEDRGEWYRDPVNGQWIWGG